MVPRLDGTDNPRSGVFLMVETPDFRNRIEFYDLPFSGAFQKVYTCAYLADKIGLRAICGRRDRIQTLLGLTIRNHVYGSAFLPTGAAFATGTSSPRTVVLVPVERRPPRK